MAKSRVLEHTLAGLARVRQDPLAETSLAELRRVLAGKSSHAVARAAQIAGEFEISQLTPELLAAFERFMTAAEKADPTCAAKTAIAEALYRIGADAGAVFLRGVCHVQMEPVWGGKADTAGGLRAACAFGLVRMHHEDAMLALADLLADAEAPVRADAARALAYSEDARGVPLLRLKVRSGDDSPEVLLECMLALLKLGPATALPLVAAFLDRPDAATREAAALALGQSRLPQAFDVLREKWERTPEPSLRRTTLLAIAMLKEERAIEFLLSLVREASGPAARDAIAALAVYRHDAALVVRIRGAAEDRTDIDLRRAVAEALADHP
jgi:HEAT repeat protein